MGCLRHHVLARHPGLHPRLDGCPVGRAQLDVSPATLVLTVAPHALTELTAVFLPLAAWTIASRKGEWGNLLAATFATVAVAIPMLVVAAAWETLVWPTLLTNASPVLV